MFVRFLVNKFRTISNRKNQKRVYKQIINNKLKICRFLHFHIKLLFHKGKTKLFNNIEIKFDGHILKSQYSKAFAPSYHIVKILTY